MDSILYLDHQYLLLNNK